MNTGAKTCTDCSSQVTTEGVLQEEKKNRGISKGPRTKRRGTSRPIEPEVVDPEEYRKDTTGTSSSSKEEQTEDETAQPSPPQHLAQSEWSNDPDTQLYLEPSIPDGIRTPPKFHLFALGWYDTEDYKRDDYSDQLIKLAKKGDMNQVAKFVKLIDAFFEQRLDETFTPDVVTAYPGHADGVSESVVALLEQVTTEQPFSYQQHLIRSEPRPRQKEQGKESRWKNQTGSIRVTGDVSGKRVLLFDDIATSGASLATGTRCLFDSGAKHVICLCLGLATRQWGEKVRQIRSDEHTISSVIEGYTV